MATPTAMEGSRKSLPAHQKPPEPPHSNSFRLPVKVADVKKNKIQPPRLLHPFLHRVPMHIRFGLNGFLSNAFFMVAYHKALEQFDGKATTSTIYSIVYLFFIPVTHASISLLVFGWPERYVSSLLSNAPVGLTAIALGAALTAYFDKIELNKMAVDYLALYLTYLGYPAEPSYEEEKGELYSSIIVLFITGIWTFVLSVVVNSPSEPSEKKEL